MYPVRILPAASLELDRIDKSIRISQKYIFLVKDRKLGLRSERASHRPNTIFQYPEQYSPPMTFICFRILLPVKWIKFSALNMN